MFYDEWDEKFVVNKSDAKYSEDCLNYDEYWSRKDEYETFEDTYITKSGDKIVAFGYHGYN